MGVSCLNRKLFVVMDTTFADSDLFSLLRKPDGGMVIVGQFLGGVNNAKS